MRSTREKLGFSLEQVAVAADVPMPRLRAWEEADQIPAAAFRDVAQALRRMARDAAEGRVRPVLRSGVPAAAEPRTGLLSRWRPGAAPPPGLREAEFPVPSALPAAEGPPFAEAGLVARAIALGRRMDGWRASAYWGAFYLVCVSLFGMFALLALAALSLDAGYALYAVGLVALMAAAGAAGGVAHHAAGPLRRRGRAGRHLAGMLVAYAGLGTGLVLLAAGHLAVEFEWLDPEMAARALSPLGAAAWVALGALLGTVLARETR